MAAIREIHRHGPPHAPCDPLQYGRDFRGLVLANSGGKEKLPVFVRMYCRLASEELG